MTNIDVKINTTAARFHFILSLSGINPVMGSAFVNSLTEKTGTLSNTELSSISNIKYYYKNLNEKNRKSLLINSFSMSEKDFINVLDKTLYGSLKLFGGRFDDYWTRSEKILNDNLKIITNDLARQENKLKEAFDALDVLFNSKTPKQIDVFLLASPINNISGKYITDNKLYIEMPIFDSLDLDKFWLLFIHETIHACYEPFSYKNWLKEFADKQPQTLLTQTMGPKNLLRELVDETIAPNGYLAFKLFSTDPKEKYQIDKNEIIEFKTEREEFNYLKKIVISNCYKTIGEYIENKKPIDEQFLDKVWKIVLTKKVLP